MTPLQTPSPPDRIRGMLWGTLVADAASLGTHWIYDLKEMAREFPQGVHGFEAPKASHYHGGKKPGDFTHYGDGAWLTLRYVAEHLSFDVREFGPLWYQSLTPAGGYSGYMDHAARESQSHMEHHLKAHGSWEGYSFDQGADDNQMASITAIAPLVTLNTAETEAVETVKRFVMLRQRNSQAIIYSRCSARLLIKLLMGGEIRTALHQLEEYYRLFHKEDLSSEVAAKINEAINYQNHTVVEATAALGQSCPLPSSFPAALHAFIKYGHHFQECVLSVIRAGGDNAGRACLVGGWLGAHLGVSAIPESWRQRLNAHDAIEEAVEKIVARFA